MGVSGPTLVSSAFSAAAIIAVSLSLEKAWLDMLLYPLSKRSQGENSAYCSAHLDKLHYTFYERFTAV
jgi:hypothetical protein